MNTKKVREAFEAWAKAHDYGSFALSDVWGAWQAAIASMGGDAYETGYAQGIHDAARYGVEWARRYVAGSDTSPPLDDVPAPPTDAQPVAYMYHDAKDAESANHLLHSRLVVLASDRRPGLRNETPLYAAKPSAPVDVQPVATIDGTKFAGWFRELPSGMSYRLWEQGGHDPAPGDVALYEFARPAQQASVSSDVQPVAWRYDLAEYQEGDLRGRGWRFGVYSQDKPTRLNMVQNLTPLYTAPPARQDDARKTLTDAQIEDCIDEANRGYNGHCSRAREDKLSHL